MFETQKIIYFFYFFFFLNNAFNGSYVIVLKGWVRVNNILNMAWMEAVMV